MRGPRLRIIAVNDVYLLDNLPRLRTLVRARAAETDVDLTLTTLAGDFLSPSLLGSVDHGVGMIECLNAVPITHVCFGNHEQDLAFEHLVARVREFRGTWLNTNMPDFEPALPAAQALMVRGEGTRAVCVGLIGAVTEEESLYRPGPFGGHAMRPLNAALESAAEALVSRGCSAVVALTHQRIERDQELARVCGATTIPLILGGHEHEVHVEQLGGAWIVKAGSDAHHVAIVDLQFAPVAPSEGPDLPAVSVHIERVGDHLPDPALHALAERHMEAVRALASAVLLRVRPGEALSSVDARRRQTSVGTLVASRVRDALEAELCFINGGGVRGAKDYLQAFTFGDLETELPFSNEVVVAVVPGAVIEAAIVESRRNAPTPSPAFLQLDDGVEVDASNRVLRVRGERFDPSREYRLATVRMLFDGLDGIRSLLAFREAHPERIPPSDAGREPKLLVVDAFALQLWRALPPFDEIDADGDARLSVDELREAARRATDEVPHALLLEGLIRLFDRDHDATISREEAARG